VPAPRTYVALNTNDWSLVPWSEEFVDITTDIVPRFRTRMKMRWDDNCLYIAAELEEPHVWATLTENDSVIFQDNDFEVFMDPDADNHYYVELEINALGTTWDLLLPKPYKDSGRPLTGWRIKRLKTAVHVRGTLNDPTDTDEGWAVEIAIPWASLKEITGRPCPPNPGDQWRINFSRVQWQHELVDGAYRKLDLPEDNWVWSAQGVVDMHRPERWGIVQFSSGPAEFRPDESLPIRELLHRVYYAQRDFYDTKKRYAPDPRELGFAEDSVQLYTTPTRFEVIAEDHTGVWHIAEDARIWKETT
jgi:hypothetical protein